ncbi:sugar nucleotide-binding protein [Collinsella aerofaciens]|uniref:sugar nucleotide-binding protein n=1 Tax=Collinsella aerofaciens TaxID=74426 RepID=UPI001957A4EC|nr:sugar nucleotide-binding protein [Collinsella aerofaciens]
MADIAFEKDLSVAETGIEGLKVVDLAVHGDSRGWFKENWQRAKMCALGIPDLKVVQNNISYNDSRGVTRGIHAEPWDKFISVARGSVFGAWVDLREGSETFGKVFTCTLDPSKAIYVPRGVGNSFQALEDGTAYTYLVDAHWSLELKKTYTFVNLADPELAIEWPIPLDEATVSEADLNQPMLKDVVPMAPKRTLVTGCNGQLGHAVRALAEERGVAKDFDFCDIDTFDMSDPDAYAQYDWSLYGTVINCGAYTAVDKAETPEGRKAIYVPRGVGNSFQALEDGTAYTYLVDAHWSLELKKTYTFVNLADPELAIEWPIPLDEATVSEADLNHPMLADVVPMAPKRTLVTGCNGQLGHAVRALAEERGVAKDFDFCDIDTFDMSDPDAYAQYDWSLYGTVINCGAYTAVDKAETPEGRVIAWKANATGPALLARTCAGHGITLVHVSSDYVFDGTAEVHTEEEPLSPLSVYGQTKAAGDIAVAGCPRHYIMRSSWVIGEGHNFVKTMKGLSDRVTDPDDKLEQVTVVDDQLGRLTFTRDMAEAIFHVLGTHAPYGTYDCTGSGAVKSWADIARAVFEAANGNGDRVVPVSTADYYANAAGPVAPRPVHSALDLSRLESTGFHMPDWEEELGEYLKTL